MQFIVANFAHKTGPLYIKICILMSTDMSGIKYEQICVKWNFSIA